MTSRCSERAACAAENGLWLAMPDCPHPAAGRVLPTGQGTPPGRPAPPDYASVLLVLPLTSSPLLHFLGNGKATKSHSGQHKECRIPQRDGNRRRSSGRGVRPTGQDNLAEPQRSFSQSNFSGDTGQQCGTIWMTKWEENGQQSGQCQFHNVVVE